VDPARDTDGVGVTIVLPLHDGARFVGDTLRSILAQTYPAFEVIVVDDGSCDDGPDIVRGFSGDPRISLVMKPRAGIARTRNYGAARGASGSRFLVFMDQDDLWDADVLETLVGVLGRRPDASGAFVLADFVDEEGSPMHPGAFAGQMRRREGLSAGRLTQRDATADLGLEQVFLNNPVYPPSCLMMRRDFFERLGGFDPRFSVADDWDLVIRLARLGPLVPVDEVKIGYRRHSANASRHTRRNVHETRRIWATAFHSPDNTAAQTELLRSLWLVHQARTASRKLSESRRLLHSRQSLRGLARAVDASGHRLLRRPLRRWAASR
jgi:glycosyltransferase involved in cell wall biosynthesis